MSSNIVRFPAGRVADEGSATAIRQPGDADVACHGHQALRIHP
jgi:hypothetical protein